jgi:hypothetical protein
VPDNDITPPAVKPRRFFREGRTASVSRELVMGMDILERRFGFAGAGIALVLALLFIPRLIKNTTITITATPSKANLCAKGYHLVGTVCNKPEITHPSYWLPQFFEFVIIGGAIAIFSYYRKRVGVIVGSFLLGLATGTAGIFFLALGGWLAVRAFRLQKYGDASFRGSNLIARERAKERRTSRGPRAPRGARTPRGARSSKSSTSSTSPTSRTPAPSKRYTPKKTNRR